MVNETNNIMKQQLLYLATLLLFFGFTSMGSAQKVYKVDYASQADIKVFVVEYESQCDLKVYKVDYQSQANKDGLWYFVDYASQADKKIFFIDYASQADLKIYFVDYQSQAGWRNKSKLHLLR